MRDPAAGTVGGGNDGAAGGAGAGRPGGGTDDRSAGGGGGARRERGDGVSASFPTGELAGVPVLVTGATGFIGGALARRLAADEGARVVGAGRELERGRWLEEAGVELVRADLLDFSRTAELVEGRELVFHCAAWVGGDPERARPVNVDAVRALAETAADAGVRRLVHVSSISAYGLPDREVIDEGTPLATDADDDYSRTKALGEVAAREAVEGRGIELVILRPGQVHGPRSRMWTETMCRMVAEGRPLLIGDGTGRVHPVYVGNLVDALLLAAVRAGAGGEAFNVVEEPVTWRDFLGHYAGLTGVGLESTPAWFARALSWLGKIPGVTPPVDPLMVAMGTNRVRFPSEKLRERLGWEPRVPFGEAMERGKAWLREEGIAP